MIKKNEVSERRLSKIRAAGKRYKQLLPSILESNTKLISKGPLGAASEQQRNRYFSRELKKVSRWPAGLGVERRIGTSYEFDALPPTEEALAAGDPVARIVELIGRNTIGEGFATGFLIHGSLLVTNWHVFAEPGDAVGVGAQFGYQKNRGGLIEAGSIFELDPKKFFLSNEELDLAIVGISERPNIGAKEIELSDFGRVRLIPTVGKILVGQPVSIIQHPDGMHKQWAIRQNKLLREPSNSDLYLQYTTDTMPGSSGAPAFNKDWELVAVHHSGVPRMDGDNVLLRDGSFWTPGDSDLDIDWVANEGVRVSKIVKFLHSFRSDQPAQNQVLEKLLNNSTDTLFSGETDMRNYDENYPTEKRTEGNLESSRQTIIVNGTANFHYNLLGSLNNMDSYSMPEGHSKSKAFEKKIRFDPDYENRPGYDTDFLTGFSVPEPTAPNGLVLKSGRYQKVLKYHHYSLAMHKERRFALWAASNVDYDEGKRWRTRKQLGEDTWKADPRIPGNQQVEDPELYYPAKKFDRGHLVRRDDVAWGHTKDEEEFGNSDSFHYTNCTPQHEEFNRAIFEYDGIWGKLESYIAKQAKYVGEKLIVFSGPILDDEDPFKDFGAGEVQVPVGFWKIVIVAEKTNGTEELKSYGFVLSQQDAIDQFGWENRFRAKRFKEQQVPIKDITDMSGVSFPELVVASDGLQISNNENGNLLRGLGSLKL